MVITSIAAPRVQEQRVRRMTKPAYVSERGLLPDALVLRISIARSFSDPISKQRCEGQLRTSHGQTQVHIWVIHRLLKRLARLGECAKSESYGAIRDGAIATGPTSHIRHG